MNTESLTEKQSKALFLMQKGENVFITGPGGVGKSLVINIFKKLFYTKRNIGITSTTGVSAVLIGGNTLHSYLGIGLGNGGVDNLIKMISKNKQAISRWKNTDTLIIDEISMLSPDLFDKLEVIARHFRKNQLPFGGIQLILSGDFCQLPVVDNNKMCFEAQCWSECNLNVVYLTEIIRQNNIEFQKCLSEIRMGEISQDSKNLLNGCVNKQLDLINGIKPTKLFSTNAKTDEINEKELDKLDVEDFYRYEMKIEYLGDFRNREKIIEKYKKNCIAPHELILCVGAQVMLIFNIDTVGGLVNGSRGIVTQIVDNRPLVKFLNGEEKWIDYNIWSFDDGGDEIVLRITQIPLKLAWAFTIHKIQGATLDFAEIDMERIFEYGQAYVALSRVKNLEGLSIKNINFESIKTHPKAKEFYKKFEFL